MIDFTGNNLPGMGFAPEPEDLPDCIDCVNYGLRGSELSVNGKLLKSNGALKLNRW